MLIYLASPYSHPSAQIREQRFIEVSKLGAELFKQGYSVFIPIAQSHPMHVYGDIHSTAWENWWQNDVDNLKNCDELWIAHMDGWDQSNGIRGEIIVAKELGLPIKLVTSSVMTTFDLTDTTLNKIIGEMTQEDLNNITKLREMTHKRVVNL